MTSRTDLQQATPADTVPTDRSGEDAQERVGRFIRAMWRLDALLGVGGMAAVYSATHRDGGRAALKIMHTELARDDDIRERFLREAKISRRVKHPGCIDIVDDDITENGVPFLVMELLEGETLTERWRHHGRRMPLSETLTIAAHLLDALAAFHDQRIVHRDIKPANIFITHEGRVKLLDLGVAQLREPGREVTRAGFALGTPAYMSPEQAMGKIDEIDARSDVYSVAATMYVLLSGKRLHRGVNEAESHVLAATQPAPSIAQVAPELPLQVIAIIDKALQWDRRNRFQSAGAMRGAINKVLESRLAEVSLESSPRPMPPPPRRQAEQDSEPRAVARQAHTAKGAPDTLVNMPPEADSQVTEAVLTSELFDQQADLDMSTAPPLTTRDPAGSESPPEDPWSDGSVPPSADGRFELRSEPPSAAGHGGGVLSVPTTRTAVVPLMPASLPPEAADAVSIALTPRDRSSKGPVVSAEVPLNPDHVLAPLFGYLDRLLRTARQYGPAHPETQNRLEPLFGAVTTALQTAPEDVHWKVLPFCFTHGEHTVWEPTPPGDLVPYTLTVAGLREIKLTAGVTEDELRELFGAMMVDVNSDPAEIATALWEAPFQHVQCSLEDEVAGEDADSLEAFFADAGDVELQIRSSMSTVQKMVVGMARRDVMEAAAMASVTELAATTAKMLQLDPSDTELLQSHMGLSRDDLRTRHHEVLLDAFVDATKRRDLQTMFSSVGAYSKRLIRLGRYADLFSAHRELLERAEQSASQRPLTPRSELITGSLFPAEVLVHVVRMTSTWRKLLGEDRAELALDALKRVAATMGPGALRLCLRLANKLSAGPPLDILAEYVARTAEGDEQRVIDNLEALNPLTTQVIMTRLIGRGGDRVKPMLEPLLASSNSALRCEAIAHLAEPGIELTKELMDLFQSDDSDVRLAALDTCVRHQVRSAGPTLVRLVEEDSFKERSLSEQQRVFETLRDLNRGRTEGVLSAIVIKHGLVSDEALDQTRTLAARMLGEWAETDGALKAVTSATKRRWWNGDALREVARHAGGAIEGRRKLKSAGKGAPA